MRQSSWLSFVLFTILGLALTACAAAETSELSFEPSLVEAEDGGFGEPALAAGPAKDSLSLAELVVELDGEAYRALAISADGCTYGQGYWKNHAEVWADTTLALGDRQYSANQLLSILNTPPRGDATYILAQQLIAAKLNGGATEAELAGYIAEADAWLQANSLDSAPADEARQEGILLAELLDDYNNGLLGEACDEDDNEEDLDDVDDLDDDAGDRLVSEDGECTGANPHPHATVLAANYGVGYEEIMARFCEGYGFGEIELAYLLAAEAAISVEEVYALRDAGLGWGNIRKQLGASPGLGNDKPNGNNDNVPPGQEKKGEDWVPPGQEKKDGDWAPPGQSNQNPNASSNPGNGNGKDK